MNYHIYFDESNKLDLTKQYSYYGAFGEMPMIYLL